ncbi:MAG: PA domain-containing protein [Saprospiraceae bacterium]|nr:PA domain-containing protein [Saprospiraceae bacterium]
MALDSVAPETNACEMPLNDLSGKIASVDRGTCSFDSKCLKVQQAGAVAVIVCNNTNAAPIAMGPATPSISAAVNIPCFMASKQDCEVLRLLTPLEINLVPVYPKFPKANVLWGKCAGQGDFNNGLNGWTVQNSICSNGTEDFDVWRWDADGVLDNSPSTEGAIVIHSPTACNGVAFFDSRLYDATPQPPCPAPQSGELVSPVINLSNVGVPGVSLQFFQSARNLNSCFFVGYSTDGGATWTEINTDLEATGPQLNNIQKVPLPGLAGSAQARFKFRMEADYYYWMIDDVRIVEQEHNNLSLNKNFYAIPPSYATPLALVEPIHFLADVSNIGSFIFRSVPLADNFGNRGILVPVRCDEMTVFRTTCIRG